MTEDQKQELIQALDAAKCLDNDLAYLPELADALATGQSAAQAVAAFKARVPGVFRQTDFAKMSPTEYEAEEAKLRANVGTGSRQFGPNEFRSLDAGRLSEEELAAMDRCVRGETNSWSRALLVKALARQRLEDSLTSPSGDAA